MVDQLSFDDREDDLRLRECWHRVLGRISALVPVQMSERFIATIQPTTLRNAVVTLAVPSTFNAEWIRRRCLHELESALSAELEETVSVSMIVKPEARKADAGQAVVRMAPAMAEHAKFTPVEKYRFDTFITGPSNRLAFAGARAVAKDPGRKYNPLFIHGPSGYGKTHLLHAIAREIQTREPGTNVNYLSAQRFTEEFVSAMQSGKIEQFRKQHRNVHVWLVDDIQFLAGKDRTQEEIFYTFNALQQTARQIVFCADRPPRDIYLMDERLRSRFESGLVADIMPPDTETRSAILISKAKQEGIELDVEIALLLAEQVSGNVRVLEGALTKLLALSSIQNEPISLQMAMHVMEKHYSHSVSARPSVPQIMEHVGKYYSIPVDHIRGTSRKAPIVLARHVSIYLTREITGGSWKHISSQFGDRDHTSMMHAYQKISEMMARDKDFHGAIHTMLRNLVPQG